MKKLAGVLGLVALGACGGGQTRLGSAFSTDWQDDGGAGVRALQGKVLATPVAKSAAVAVGVADGRVLGVPLAGGTGWSFAHAVDSRPQLAGSVVVATGGGEIFALDALTGAQLWARKGGGALRGVGDDGKTTVMSLATSGESSSIILAVSHDGTVLRQLEVKPAVGIPAVVGNYAFLPWAGQYVTAYNVATGEEEARILFREQVSRAFTHGGKLYFGELGLFRFDDRISLAREQKASHVALPLRELPGDPRWFPPGAERRTLAADARDKIALFAAPANSAQLALDSDRFVATYFKVAVGFDAKTGAVAWAQKHPADFVAGSAFDGGVALCDTDGTITMVSSTTGATLSKVSLGAKVQSCTVEADSLVPARAAASLPTKKTLAEQIADVIDVNENEMFAMQKVLLRSLGKLEDPKATKALVDLASDPRTPPTLLADVETALAARRTGADYMLESLARHYDFLKDVLRPPPVGPLADALAGMKETRAAPALVSHLFDPADTTNAIKRAAAALEQVGTKAELSQQKTFFALYRTMATDDELSDAVFSTAKCIVKLGTPDDKALIARAAEDPLTVTALKPRLASLLQ